MKIKLYLRIRRVLTDIFDKMVTLETRTEEIHQTLTNHVIHKLEDHDKQFECIENKLDTITEKLSS